MHRHNGLIAMALVLMAGLMPASPANAYIDAQRAYEMALNHHY